MLEVHGGAVGTMDVAHRSSVSIDVAAPGGGSATRADEVARRAGAIVDRILRSKGYRVQPVGTGDLRVLVRAARRDETVSPIVLIPLPSGRQAGRVEASEREDIAEGALVIDAFDGATGAMVWHGAARVIIDPSSIDEVLLERATGAVLTAFPAHAPER